MQSHFVDLNGQTYHVVESGSGNTVVLLHGFTGSSENWQSLMGRLSSYFQVFAVDLLGHGKTSLPNDSERYTMPHAAADLIALIDLLNVDHVNLLGYSMGGRLALYLAVHYPQRINQLILESASPGLKTWAERIKRVADDDNLAQRILDKPLEQFVAYWQSIPLFDSQKTLPQDLRQRLYNQRLKNQPQGLANSLRGMGTGSQPPLWDDLKSLYMPTHMIVGSLDTKFVDIAESMYRSIPDSTITLMPDVGHSVHLERPDDYAEFVLSRL